MSTSDYREPTNDELWPQAPNLPPASGAALPGQAMVPHQAAPTPAPVPAATSVDRTRFILAMVSLGLGIPISAIAGGTAGLPGLLIAWVAIVAVNFIYSRRRP